MVVALSMDADGKGTEGANHRLAPSICAGTERSSLRKGSWSSSIHPNKSTIFDVFSQAVQLGISRPA